MGVLLGYASNRKTQGTIRTDTTNWNPWLVFVLRSLADQVRRLEPSVADRLPHTDHEQKSVKLLAVNSLQAVLPLFTLVPIARS